MALGLDPKSISATLEAMTRGDAVIVQAALQSGWWNGRADVLRSVETPSRFGAWSYEVTDTKLARETKGNTVLQISLYSDMLSAMQGVEPTAAHVVTPGTNFEPETYRIADYSAYYRHVRSSLERAITDGAGAAYPEPIEHCDICRWRRDCDDRRRRDDHMSLVAGISKSQIGELTRRGVGTTAALGAMPVPLEWRPERGATKSYEKVREQARIQVEGRTSGSMKYEALLPIAGFGLSRLPAPSRGDIFFDFEGDPFVGEGGLEFLFGYSFLDHEGKPAYVGDWASDRREERAAFERFVDFVTERLKSYPDLHIYHFAPYEPATMKRLMGRYASRENEVDNLLRAEVFVDLFAVVRHGIRASVESYSIKKLEPLYSFTRSVPLEDVGAVMARIQARLEMADAAGIPDADKDAIRGYNKDDCELDGRVTGVARSAARPPHCQRRRQSNGPLQSLRRLAKNSAIGRRGWQRSSVGLRKVFRTTSPSGRPNNRPAGCWPSCWIGTGGRRRRSGGNISGFAIFRRETFSTNAPVSPGLRSRKQPVAPQRCPFIGTASSFKIPIFGPTASSGASAGRSSVASLPFRMKTRTIDIKKRGDTAEFHPEAVFAHKSVDRDERPEALFRLGQYVAENGIEGAGEHRAARDLLLSTAPRLKERACRSRARIF